MVLSNGLEVLLISEPLQEDREEDEDDDDEGGKSDDDGFEDVDSGDESKEEGEDGEEASEDEDGSGSEGGESGGGDKKKSGPQLAAVAMAVNVGSWADPPDTPGCAHAPRLRVFLLYIRIVGRKNTARARTC